MMRLPVQLREEAISDLEEIANHIVDRGGSAGVALGFGKRIKLRCEKLGDAPIGSPLREDLGPGIRLAPFEHTAVIAYRVLSQYVEVVNIFYGGRDYEALMREHPNPKK